MISVRLVERPLAIGNSSSFWARLRIFLLAFARAPALFAVLASSGCSSDDAPPSPPASALATGSKCPNPTSPAITYQGWARGFFESYCTRCHSSTLVTNSERNGATPHANWDDLGTIRAYADEIDSYAAGGPNGINRIMPPSEPTPTDEERTMLGEWLACGAPN
jgi:hypothetical protein